MLPFMCSPCLSLQRMPAIPLCASPGSSRSKSSAVTMRSYDEIARALTNCFPCFFVLYSDHRRHLSDVLLVLRVCDTRLLVSRASSEMIAFHRSRCPSVMRRPNPVSAWIPDQARLSVGHRLILLFLKSLSDVGLHHSVLYPYKPFPSPNRIVMPTC